MLYSCVLLCCTLSMLFFIKKHRSGLLYRYWTCWGQSSRLSSWNPARQHSSRGSKDRNSWRWRPDSLLCTPEGIILGRGINCMNDHCRDIPQARLGMSSGNFGLFVGPCPAPLSNTMFQKLPCFTHAAQQTQLQYILGLKALAHGVPLLQKLLICSFLVIIGGAAFLWVHLRSAGDTGVASSRSYTDDTLSSAGHIVDENT